MVSSRSGPKRTGPCRPRPACTGTCFSRLFFFAVPGRRRVAADLPGRYVAVERVSTVNAPPSVVPSTVYHPGEMHSVSPILL